MKPSALALATSLALLLTPAAKADGIEMRKILRPGPNSTYTVNAQILTDNTVSNLKFGIFYTNEKSGIEGPVPEVQFRPNRLSTRAGVKQRLLAFVPPVSSEKQLALCIWSEAQPDISSISGSQLLSAFRYCKLFTVKP